MMASCWASFSGGHVGFDKTGAMALQVIPREANSLAMDLVNPRPALLAA